MGKTVFPGDMNWVCSIILENIILDGEDKLFVMPPGVSLGGANTGYIIKGLVKLGLLEKITGQRIVSIKERIGGFIKKPSISSSGFIIKDEQKIREWSEESPCKTLEQWILYYNDCKKDISSLNGLVL